MSAPRLCPYGVSVFTAGCTGGLECYVHHADAPVQETAPDDKALGTCEDCGTKDVPLDGNGCCDPCAYERQ